MAHPSGEAAGDERTDAERAAVAEAPPQGGTPVTGQGRLLVPDRRLAAVHARSDAQLRCLRLQSPEPASRSFRTAPPGALITSPGSETASTSFISAGWLADFPIPTTSSSHYQPMFGFEVKSCWRWPPQADAETNLARRARLYEQASRLLMKILPLVPYVNFRYAVALRKNVTGFVPGSSGPNQRVVRERRLRLSLAKRTFRDRYPNVQDQVPLLGQRLSRLDGLPLAPAPHGAGRRDRPAAPHYQLNRSHARIDQIAWLEEVAGRGLPRCRTWCPCRHRGCGAGAVQGVSCSADPAL